MFTPLISYIPSVFLSRRLFNASSFLLVCSWAGSVQAYNKVEITLQEYDRWPRYCQATGHTDVSTPKGRVKPVLSSRENKLNSSVGIWHYCMGLIHVLRAERYFNTQQGIDLVNRGFKDLMYSYKRISKTEPLAAEMAVTIARAYRVKGDNELAIKYLETARELSPEYAVIYSVLSSLYFDKKQYAKAVEVLKAGNLITQGKSAELNYFLGLAYINLGKIQLAKKYEAVARSLGYPLLGLSIKIREQEKK